MNPDNTDKKAESALNLEHCPATTFASHRRPEEITGGVKDQAGIGIPAVATVAIEAMQNLFTPISICLGSQLKHGASAIDTANLGCAVEITGTIEDKASQGNVSICPAILKAVQTF